MTVVIILGPHSPYWASLSLTPCIQTLFRYECRWRGVRWDGLLLCCTRAYARWLGGLCSWWCWCARGGDGWSSSCLSRSSSMMSYSFCSFWRLFIFLLCTNVYITSSGLVCVCMNFLDVGWTLEITCLSIYTVSSSELSSLMYYRISVLRCIPHLFPIFGLVVWLSVSTHSCRTLLWFVW